MRGQPAAVAGEDDLVEVREAVVAELEGAQLDAAFLGLDPLPGRERDHEVGALGVERVVGGGVQGHGLERAGPAVGLDDALERRFLVGVAEARVRPPVEVLGPGDVGGGEDRDLLGGVLEDGHDRDDRRPGRGREGEGVLEADPALGLAGGDQCLGGRAGVGQDLEVDAGLVVPAIRLGDVDAGVVGVRRPVEGETDLPERSGLARRRGRSRRLERRSTASPSMSVKGWPRRDRTRRPRRRWRVLRQGCASCVRAPRSTRRCTKRRLRKNGDGVNKSKGLLPSPVLAGSGSAGLWPWPHSQRTRAPRRRYSVRRES